MVKLTIKKKKDLLQGIQDSIICQFDDYIFLIGGFCCGPDDRPQLIKHLANPKTSYKRGFFNDIWRYSISKNEWIYIGKLECMKPRQSHFSEVVDNKVYIFGGFSYTPLSEEDLEYYEVNNISLPTKSEMCTFSDYFCLEYNNGFLNLIDKGLLPYPISYSKCKYFNGKLYIFGGCVYLTSYISVEMNNTGKRLLVIKLDDNGLILKNNFEIIESFPGTPRYGLNLELINNQLYIFGGSYSSKENIHTDKGYVENTEYNVIDNWKFDLVKNKWEEIPRFPFTITYPSSIEVDNIIYFFGGVKFNQSLYKNEINNDEISIDTTEIWLDYKSKEKVYNGISTIPLLLTDGLYARKQFNGYFGNIIFSYNLKNKKFFIQGELPLQVSLPILTKYIKDGKKYIFTIPNESNFILINNKYYGIHSSLFLRLEINK
jgi:N-acetylneuraminic acid mutarotase